MKHLVLSSLSGRLLMESPEAATTRANLIQMVYCHIE